MADNGLCKLDVPVNRYNGYADRRSLAASALLVILDLAWAGLTVAAENAPSKIAPASLSLFSRQPLGFDQGTGERTYPRFGAFQVKFQS